MGCVYRAEPVISWQVYRSTLMVIPNGWREFELDIKLDKPIADYLVYYDYWRK